MRTVKFRAKLKDSNEWVCGGGVQKIKDVTVMLSIDVTVMLSIDEIGHLVVHEVDPETVGQLWQKDKNGKDIYEGYIVKDSERSYVLKFGEFEDTMVDDLMFGWYMESIEDGIYKSMQFVPYSDTDQLEVIGNIHDNPELL